MARAEHRQRRCASPARARRVVPGYGAASPLPPGSGVSVPPRSRRPWLARVLIVAAELGRDRRAVRGRPADKQTTYRHYWIARARGRPRRERLANHSGGSHVPVVPLSAPVCAPAPAGRLAATARALRATVAGTRRGARRARAVFDRGGARGRRRLGSAPVRYCPNGHERALHGRIVGARRQRQCVECRRDRDHKRHSRGRVRDRSGERERVAA